MSTRVLVVEHHESCPPHLVGRWLEEAGCTLEVCRPWTGEALPALTSYDAVLVLGGDMGADDDDAHWWLGPLKAGIREAVAAGTPLLGICLGHQLIAAALGGTVTPNPRGQTVGLQPVGWTEDAVVLARTPGGEVQVARFGPRAWGIQAHPEVDSVVVTRWAASDRDDHVSLGLDQDEVLAAIERSLPALAGHWQPMTARFAEIAGARR
jgi:GMP synthase (glutamine-hydrolysing)